MPDSYEVRTRDGSYKSIELHLGCYEDLGIQTDILVCSAFKGDYAPLRGTLIGSIAFSYGINVAVLARNPFINLNAIGTWVSQEIKGAPFSRLACVELVGHDESPSSLFDNLFFGISKAVKQGVSITSIAMPVLGTGDQMLSYEDVFLPLLSECVDALETIPSLERIVFFERNEDKYNYIRQQVELSLPKVKHESVFISYSHRNTEVANMIAGGLKGAGLKVWIDHEKLRNPKYAEEIIDALRNSKAYVILVSSDSLKSHDVLRELRNAGELEAQQNMRIYQALLERVWPYPSEFNFYLSGHDWCDFTVGPVEDRIHDLCEKVMFGINEARRS